MKKTKLITARRFGIFVCIFTTLVVSQAGNHNIIENNIKTEKYKFKTNFPINEIHKTQHYTTKKPIPSIEVIVSAYDLSYQSCQKSRNNSQYGITSSGFDLKGHTLSSARVISTDPKIIPTGSKVKIVFNDPKYTKYNNVYYALDQGGLIKNNHIDLFIGDFRKSTKMANIFGVTTATVTILK